MIKFKANRTYKTRSICDHEHIISVSVVRRTAKTVWTDEGKKFRINIYNDIEFIKPWGSYSMAPMVSADKEYPFEETLRQRSTAPREI